MRKKEEYFKTNLAVHSDVRSSKYCEQTRIGSASCFEKCVYHAGMKMFTNPSYSLKNLVNKEASRIKRAKRYVS